MKHSLAKLLLVVFITSCSTGSTLMQSIMYGDDGLSESEVIEGLKTALNIGTDKAVTLVSDPDGYLKDQAIKILLPQELNKLINDLRDAPGGEQIYNATIKPLIEDLIVAINRSASDAATKAIPIFKDAITEMTIQDGYSILKGDYKNAGNSSATRYFQDKTSADLSNLFQPSIESSLNKPLIGNTSANTIWNKFLQAYNAVQKSPANFLMNLDPVNEPDLSVYVTDKALDGLFVKIADEEKEIRDDPYKYANDIIKKVFGDDAIK